MTEVDPTSRPPTAVHHSSRTEPMLNEAVLRTMEGEPAAVAPVAVSKTPSTDIRSDIESNKSQADQADVKSQEFLGPGPLALRRLLVYGIPPVSFYAALSSKRLKSWGITPYWIIMTTVLVLGIPYAFLSFLENSAMASGVIAVGVAICTALLLWVKEYRDQDKNWAPWFFEKDVSEFLVTVWFITQMAISSMPVVLISFQIEYLLFDMMFPNVMSYTERLTVSLTLAFCLQTGASWLVVLTIVSDRSRLWLRKMHFVPRMLLEEVMIVAQSSICILLWIGCARLRGVSFDAVMYTMRGDLRTAFQAKGSIPTLGAILGATWYSISALKWAWAMGKRRLLRRI